MTGAQMQPAYILVLLFLLPRRDVTEPVKIQICRIQIVCSKSAGFKFGFVPQSHPSHFIQAKWQNAA